MHLKSMLTRLDEESLAKFLSKSAFRVLKAMDPRLVHLHSLSNLVENEVPNSLILREPEMRNIIFDVMRKEELLQLLSKLGIQNSDNPAKLLSSMSFTKNSKKEKGLFDYFKTDVPTESVQENEDVVILPNPDHGLFDYQHDAMKQIEKYLVEDGRAMLHMPTGAGKTRTAMRIVASHMFKQKPSLVIWLAYNRELCEQALEEFTDTWKHVGDRSAVKLIRFFGNRNPDVLLETEDHGGVFLVAGLSKMRNAAKQNLNFLAKLRGRASMVIMDEAHQAIAPTYKFVLDQLVTENNDVKLLGLSATPGRTENSDNLAKFFKRRKVTINDDDPVGFLIRNGYLAEPEVKQLPYNMEELTASESKKLVKAYDIPDEILEKMADDEKRNIMIIRAIEDLVIEKNKRILVFGTTVRHARDIAIILAAKKYHAFYITNDTPPDVREKTIKDFSNDESDAKILCNFGILSMGFDVPKISAVVIARPTKSLVLYSQMVGRATRGINAGGTANCSIRTVVDSSLQHLIASNVFFYWEDAWK